MTNKHLDSVWKDLSVWKKEIDIKDEALTRRKAVHDKVKRVFCIYITKKL